MTDDTDDRTLRVDLSVPEMDCPSCAGTVERALDAVEGIESLDLRPTSGTAVIAYDPAVTSRDRLVAAVERAGYAVDESADGGVSLRDPATVWRTRRAIGIWVGAVLLGVGLLAEFVLPALGLTVPGVVVELPGVGATHAGVADVAFLAAAAVSGTPVVRAGLSSARVRSLDIDLLMGLAIVAAAGIGYFVEAATLAVLYSMAELLERYAMDRTRDSLRELVQLSPESATVRRDGEEVTVAADDVLVGDLVVVRPGERIPIDGAIVEGESAIDESAITGESLPADRAVGDDVYAGSIAEDGYLEVEATARAEDSTLARIVELVREAQAGTTEQEQFVDRFASYYTPIVVAFAILTVAVPPLAFGGAFGTWFVRGLTLLVIACPCAFVISTPVSVASGVTAAAKNGVLIKGGQHLEAMGEVDAVAVDKTGTLTKGELTVTDVVPLGEASTDELLATVAALESRSEHPIADAVAAYAADAGVDVPDVADFQALPGRGVQGRVGGETLFAGKPALLADQGIDLSHLHVRADGGTVAESLADCERDDCLDVRADVVADLQAEGKTVVLVGSEERLLGAVAIADELRPNAERAVSRLRELGVERVVMLTGDNEGTARAVAETVGIDEYRAGLLPEEKVAAVEELCASYGDVSESNSGARGTKSGGVAMVGDGINDAPSLARATVGVAMGAAGTDTAIETADVALMGDDLTGLPYCYALAGQARSVIRQNVWSSLGVKLLLAVGAPLGYVTVAMAVLVGDMGMSLGVTGNAMRLARLDPEDVLD